MNHKDTELGFSPASSACWPTLTNASPKKGPTRADPRHWHVSSPHSYSDRFSAPHSTEKTLLCQSMPWTLYGQKGETLTASTSVWVPFSGYNRKRRKRRGRKTNEEKALERREDDEDGGKEEVEEGGNHLFKHLISNSSCILKYSWVMTWICICDTIWPLTDRNLRYLCSYLNAGDSRAQTGILCTSSPGRFWDVRVNSLGVCLEERHSSLYPFWILVVRLLVNLTQDRVTGHKETNCNSCAQEVS